MPRICWPGLRGGPALYVSVAGVQITGPGNMLEGMYVTHSAGPKSLTQGITAVTRPPNDFVNREVRPPMAKLAPIPIPRSAAALKSAESEEIEGLVSVVDAVVVAVVVGVCASRGLAGINMTERDNSAANHENISSVYPISALYL